MPAANFSIFQRHPEPALPDNFHELVEYSILASEINASDPMEKAFKELGQDYLGETEHLHHDWELVGDYNLTRQLLALSHVWKSKSLTNYVIASKGAPEAVADLCHFGPQQMAELSGKVSGHGRARPARAGSGQSGFQPGAFAGKAA